VLPRPSPLGRSPHIPCRPPSPQPRPTAARPPHRCSLHPHPARAPPAPLPTMAEQDQVANRVLRRAQVSKMTRTLQNRLALANVKMKNGWESLSLDAIEPVVDVELKRKRPGSSNETMSEASSVSERFYQPSVLDSSPLAAPIFSDDLQPPASRSGSSRSHSKRPRYDRIRYPASSSHARTKVKTSTTTAASWKNSFQLPESSPVCHRRHARFGRQHVPSLSFVSETSTVPDGQSPLLSEEDDEDLPITSFALSKSFAMGKPNFHSSPPRVPRTPPPDVARSARLRQPASLPLVLLVKARQATAMPISSCALLPHRPPSVPVRRNHQCRLLPPLHPRPHLFRRL